jgi:DNA-binding transcriptional ArsR family regulator
MLANLLGSKSRAAILARLYSDPDAELHVRELARQTGFAVRTASLEIERLVRAGLIRERRNGNRRYLRADVEWPAFHALAELIRLTGEGGEKSLAPRPSHAVPPGAAEVAAARHQRLLSDLRLTPEKRLRHAESLLHLAPRYGPGTRAQVIGFDSYEDFARWKKGHRIEKAIRS